MVGKGRRGVLGVEAPDPVLSLASSLGLALSAGTALVVDVEGGLAVRRSLGDVSAEGPTLHDLSPGHPGVALISGAGVDYDQLTSLVEMFADRWPAVVLRCMSGQWAGPTVPVRALLPGLLSPSHPGVAVWQPTTRRMQVPGDGPVLPLLSRRTTRALLSGRAVPSNRWVRAWSQVWELPWA